MLKIGESAGECGFTLRTEPVADDVSTTEAQVVASQGKLSQTQVNATNTSLHYRIYTNGTARKGLYGNDLDAAGVLTVDTWAHVCFLMDAYADPTSRKIYVNGDQVADDAGKSAYLGTAGDTMGKH